MKTPTMALAILAIAAAGRLFAEGAGGGSVRFDFQNADFMQAGAVPEETVSLSLKDADIEYVVRLLARHADLNIVLLKGQLKGQVSLELQNVPIDAALRSVLRTKGYDLVPDADDGFRVQSRDGTRTGITLLPDRGPSPPARVHPDHVEITAEGIDDAYAQALARTAEAARAAAIEKFGFDMPAKIRISAAVKPGEKTRLYTDGRDRFFLIVSSPAKLRKPAESGVFNLYGMCHEMGHLAMYRLIGDHSWMTGEAAEAWAHYLGSRLVDEVYAREGGDLWPDRYDYRADGMKRLERQLAGSPSESQPAGLWMKLAEIAGDRGIAPIFRAWGAARIDPADPAPALREALTEANSNPALMAWWSNAEPVFVAKRPKSDVGAETIEPGELSGGPVELANDDGVAAGKSSIAGSGHAVRFEAPDGEWYLTSVSLHGSRYGYPSAPNEDFHIWLCDADFKTIADFPQPYSTFKRGASDWVKMPVRPTRVPREFIICVGFNPTATKGVYVSRDAGPSGRSMTGLPGQRARPLGNGNWLIRASIDRPNSADPLKVP